MNGTPCIPQIRSATINAHGDIAPESLTRVRCVYGAEHYVDSEALSGSRVLLTRYESDGRLMGRLRFTERAFQQADHLHRDNIAEVLA